MRGRVVAAAIGLVLAAIFAAIGTAPLPARLTTAPSTVVTWRDGTFAHVFLAPDDRWRIPAAPDGGKAAIDPAYVEALLAYEDKRFRWHPGVDPIAVARAVAVNLRAGRVETGASTLTLQLVRMLEPRPRTMTSKLIEAVRALTLELRLSKQEILAAYLTFAPYGGNVEGVRAASWAYFGHDADHLTQDEIAVLLAVPQDPGRAPGRDPARLTAGRDAVLRRIAPDAVASEPVPTKVVPFPREIPHLAVWLHRRAPGEIWLNTTLDRGRQGQAERAIAAVADDRRLQGIRHTTAIVVEHTTGDVVALVGGFAFGDGAGTQIPAFDHPRSPGSALKPLLYALAIDRGLALPEYLVPDVPRAYGTYTPENYDGSFDGVVGLESALSRSLNLPFVYLLENLRVEPFLGTLRAMGATHLVGKPGHYGLSLAAGGIELTPMEMVSIYATFGAEGVSRPLRILQDEAESRGIRVLSPGAVWLTRRALVLKDRPDFPARWKVSSAPRGIAWKTGTSFGHRDAWAAGWDTRYAAVVWMGNLDNRSAIDLVGANAAGPVLFDVLEALADPRAVPPERPADLAAVEVCSYSGHLPGAACPTTRVAYAPGEHVPTATCPYHVFRDVDMASGLAVTPSCRTGRTWERRSFVVWPPSVRRFLADTHHQLPEPPSWAPGCAPSADAVPPRIITPADNQVAVLIPGLPAEEQELPLVADVDRPGARLTWFVDGEAVGTAAGDERVWWIPTLGRHELVVVDDAGGMARRWLEVRDRP